VNSEETQVGLLYAMPMGGTLEIRSTHPVEEDIGSDEEIEGVVYKIYWHGVPIPFCTNTLLKATIMAFGCQWGAQEMSKRFRGY